MHTAPLGEGVPEVAGRTGDAVLRHVLLQTRGLRVRVILLLPPAVRDLPYNLCRLTDSAAIDNGSDGNSCCALPEENRPFQKKFLMVFFSLDQIKCLKQNE